MDPADLLISHGDVPAVHTGAFRSRLALGEGSYGARMVIVGQPFIWVSLSMRLIHLFFHRSPLLIIPPWFWTPPAMAAWPPSDTLICCPKTNKPHLVMSLL
jgi:hypothetical protein